MKKIKSINRFAFFAVLTSFCFAITSCSDDDDNNTPIVTPPDPIPNMNFTALSNNNAIVKYNSTNLSSPMSTTPITGLTAGDQIISIDYRPATGQLYGLGSSSRLYFINEQSGLATALGATPFTPVIAGANASIVS